jgi:hypothetical protein
MEKLWTTLIIPVGIDHSLKEPLVTLKGGDYSHFERFRIGPDALEMADHVKWMNEQMTYPTPPGERRITNMKQILQESFRFADSEEELGLQLADIVASACRRVFNGNLQRSGWEKLGQLLIRKNGKPPIIGMRTPEQAAGCDRSVHAEAAAIWLALDSSARSMWP